MSKFLSSASILSTVAAEQRNIHKAIQEQRGGKGNNTDDRVKHQRQRHYESHSQTDPLRIQILRKYGNKKPIHSNIHTRKQKNKFIPSAAFTPVHDFLSLSLSQGSVKRRLAFFITVLKTKNRPINQGKKPEKKSKKAMADESVSYMFNAEKLCREDAGRLGFRVEAFAPLSGKNSKSYRHKNTQRERHKWLRCSNAQNKVSAKNTLFL